MRRALTVVAAGLVLAACTSTPEPVATPAPTTASTATSTSLPESSVPESSEPESSEPSSPEPSTTGSTAPSTSRSAPSFAVAPDTRVDAGTVAEGTAPVQVTGTGPTTVDLLRDGEFAVVARLDCTGCSGPVELTGKGRADPFGRGEAPWSGTFLVEIMEGSAAQQELYVQAEGPWSLELLSWNDLPPVQGPQSGTGSTVLFVSDQAPGFDVQCSPLPGENCSFRAVSAVDTGENGPASRIFGSDEEFSDSIDLQLPAVVTITTNGTWTLTPTP